MLTANEPGRASIVVSVQRPGFADDRQAIADQTPSIPT
jgi:hypothetical protein